MRYVIQCEKCKRPAEVEKQSTSWKEGQRYIKKVQKNTCECGGKIKPMID